MLVSAQASAANCKVTTVQIENEGKFQTETATVCKEGAEVGKIKIGDSIAEYKAPLVEPNVI